MFIDPSTPNMNLKSSMEVMKVQLEKKILFAIRKVAQTDGAPKGHRIKWLPLWWKSIKETNINLGNLKSPISEAANSAVDTSTNCLPTYSKNGGILLCGVKVGQSSKGYVTLVTTSLSCAAYKSLHQIFVMDGTLMSCS